MNKNSNYIIYSIIIFSICFYAFLTGCGNSPNGNPVGSSYSGGSSGSTVPLTKDITISQDGRVARTTSPTGMLAVEAPEQNTYNSEVVLKITESPSVGNESSLLTVGSKIYAITATRDGQPINLLSHPLNLTFSNEEKLNGAKNYYIGIKEIGDEAWQFVNVYSVNPTVRTGLSSTGEFSYSLFKNNILIALFSDVHKSLQSTPKVLNLTTTFNPSVVPVNNSVYTSNLRVNMLLRGENLSSLTADKFKVKVAYVTSSAQYASLKVDDRAVTYLTNNSSNRYEAFGEGYAHYFVFTPLSSKFFSGSVPSVLFDINLKDLPVSDFSSDFIVEISNADSNILPFAYSSLLHFTKSGSNTDTNTNTSTDTNTGTDTNIGTETNTNTDTYTNTGTNTGTDPQQPKATINLKSPAIDFPVTGTKLELEFSRDITWNNNDKNKIFIDNNVIINDWSYTNRVLSLSIKDKLAYNTIYVVKVTDMTGVENATLVFKTENIGTVALKSAATDFQVSNSKIELEFSKEIPWTMADRAKIAIDNSVEITDYIYANKVLTLALKKKLRFGTVYLINVSGLEGIENNTLVLKTEGNAEAILKSSSEDVSVYAPIEIEFSKDIYFENEDISNISLDNGAEIDESSYANKVLSLRVKGKLNYDTLYTLTFNGVNGVVAGKTLTFKTGSISVRPVISLAEDSIMPNMNGRTALKPKFYIDFGKPIASNTLAMSNIKFNGNDLPEGCILDFDADMQNATLSFASDLEEAVDCTLTIKEYTDEDNGKINSTEFAFRTMPPEIMPGSGTIDDPFRVYHQNHLKQLANKSPINYLQGGFFFKQIDDITLVGEWNTIGKDNYEFFTGNYDGNSRSIFNLNVHGTTSWTNYSSLFYGISNGSVTNLTIRDVSISGYENNSIICTTMYNSIIENIKIEGNINISSSGNYTGAITTSGSGNTIRNVGFTGNINISGINYVGPIIGRSYGNNIISNCYIESPEGLIKGSDSIGGLIGWIDGRDKVDNCYAHTNVEGNMDIGGFVGRFYGDSINNCYSDCQITINNDNNSYYIGGLVGYTYADEGTINNCYASGTIIINHTKAKNVGTLIGDYNKLGSINNSFSSVKIMVSNEYTYDGGEETYDPDAAGTPLWYKYDYSLHTGEYVYNSDGTNYFGNGYQTTLGWNTAYWYNLTEGCFPKLIGLPIDN